MSIANFRRHRAASAFRKPLLSPEARNRLMWAGDAAGGLVLVAFMAACFCAASVCAHLLNDVQAIPIHLSK